MYILYIIVIVIVTVYSVYEFMNYDVARDIVLFINTLICVSYPVNFAIYCGMSRWPTPIDEG